ncbi:MAG TPA: histidine phosphatase family protein [Kiritimatiellia bacterium]|nr:histidine phosphatase family protein [Kiritimatiellia bacterium]
MDSLQHLYLIRHGMREDFVDPTWRERAKRPYDPPLSAAGFRQAALIAEALKDRGITTLISSPFLRALQTAAPLAEAADVPIFVEPGFGEWLNPAWMSGPPDLPNATQARALFARVDTEYRPKGSSHFPEHDERVEVSARIQTTLRALLQDYQGGAMAIVAHGSPLGQSIAWLIPGATGVSMQVGSITRIERREDEFRLITSGTDHLGEAGSPVRLH